MSPAVTGRQWGVRIVVVVALLGLLAGAGIPSKLPTAAASGSGYWFTATPAALPANAAVPSVVVLKSISCPSAGNCAGVGSYTDSSGHRQGLLLTETNGAWATGVEAALPANASAADPSVHLYSVSCASAGNCTAVGAYVDNSVHDNGQGLLLTETNGTWATGVELTLPGDATTINQNVQLGSIACASAGNCTAVGSYLRVNGQSNAPAGLLVTQTAGAWGAGVEAPFPANAATYGSSGVGSVSCSSAGNCVAVGAYDKGAALFTETGGIWATGVELTVPDNTTFNHFAPVSVSCPSAGNCAVVGADSGGVFFLDETAGAWGTAVQATLPDNDDSEIGAGPPRVFAISCASAGNCGAVGDYPISTTQREGLLFTESSGTWETGVEATLPADASASQQYVQMTSISCPTAGNCSAVGGYNVTYETNYTEPGGLLLTENDGTWATGTQVALPANANGQTGAITSIACSAPQQCQAVGSAAPPDGAALLFSGTNTAPQETLTVSTAGTGSGTLTTTPSGIDCGATCSASFDIGSVVTLTATPGDHTLPNLVWSGACADTGYNVPCQVSIGGASAASARFYLENFEVTVQVAGAGSGTVEDSPPGAGLICPGTCHGYFEWGTHVGLLETPAEGSVFAGWTGGSCSGTGEVCSFKITADTGPITATFDIAPCVVPNVKGKRLARAKAAILHAHCKVGGITKKASKRVKKGRVISQSPAAGAQRHQGFKVRLVVSKGRPQRR